MKLHEIHNEPDIKKAVKDFVGHLLDDEISYHINPDGRVDFDDDVHYIGPHFTDGVPPVKFGRIKGSLHLNGCGITALGDWLPTDLTGSLDLSMNTIHDLSTMPLGGKYNAYYLDGCPLTNLKNIHKVISSTLTIGLNNCPIKSHILGLCLIKDLRSLGIYINDTARLKKTQLNTRYGVNSVYVNADTGEIYDATTAALTVVRKYLGGSRTKLLTAQQELLDLELDDYAQL